MKFLQRLLPLAVAFLPMTCALSDPVSAPVKNDSQAQLSLTLGNDTKC